MRRLKLALEFCGGVFAGLVFLLGAAMLRLAAGPVPLDAVAPYLAAGLSNPQSGVKVAIDHALARLGEGERIEFLARGVAVTAGSGGSEIALPELVVDLSLRAALHGRIAPYRIILERPSLRLERDAAGSFHLGLAEDATSEATVGQVLRDLSGPIDARAPIAALTELAIRRAGIVVEDQALGLTWRVRDADLVLDRSPEGLHGSLSVAGGAGTRLVGEIRYARAHNRLDAEIFVHDLVPASLAAAPALTPLALADLPVSGRLRATLDPSRLAILAASCDLRIGAGMLRHAAFPAGAIAVAAGQLEAAYDPSVGKVAVERADLDLGGPTVVAHGSVEGVGDGLLAGAWPHTLEAVLDLRGAGVTAASLPRLWPEQMAPDARQWVMAHVRDGTVDHADLHLGLKVDLDAAEPVSFDALSGTFDYRQVSLGLAGALPPLQDLAGSATVGRDSITFTPSTAAMLGIHLADATVTIDALGTATPQLAATLGLKGPLRDAMTVLDAEPIRALRPFDLSGADISGAFDGHVAIAFALSDRLRRQDVDLSADAVLDDVAVRRARLGWDVTDGMLRLRLDRQGLRLDGTAAVAGAPVELALRRSLADADAAGAVLQADIRARLDRGARRALGVDFPGVVAGPVGLSLAYRSGANDRAEASVSLDLGDSDLALAPLGWRKAAGVPAAARFGVSLAGMHPVAIHDASLSGGGLEARLAATFDRDSGRVTRIDLDRLVAGATDATGTAVRDDAGAWRIALSGPGFDATALRHDYDHFLSDRDDGPLELEARFDRLVLGAGREARDVRLRLVGDGTHWETASADATLASGVPARLRYGKVAGQQRFLLQSDDFGGLLRLLDLTDNVSGGRIELSGTAVDDGPRRRLKLAAAGSDYRVVNAPLLARLLSVASFSGIGALLAGEGIPFSRLDAGLVVGEDRIALDTVRAYGGAIGISASGSIDRKANTLDLSGTLVPAYRLNSVLGNIPVIGSLLMGGEGEGMFGANFRIAGPVAEPGISVNPLSALAPGFLRNLFLFAAPNPAPEAAAAPTDAAK